VTAASRGHTNVLEFLLTVEAIDVFLRNKQNESVYDILAEKQDLATCTLIEQLERTQFAKSHPNGTSHPPTRVLPC